MAIHGVDRAPGCGPRLCIAHLAHAARAVCVAHLVHVVQVVHVVRWTALIVALPLAGSGCTILGAAIGESTHHDAKRVHDVPEQALGSLGPNHVISVTARDGATVRGIYRGMAFSDSAEYGLTYAAQRPESFPSLGDSVRLIRTWGDAVTGRFRGLDAGLLLVERGSIVEAHDVRVADTLWVDSERFVSGDALRDRARLGPWPRRSSMVLSRVREQQPPRIQLPPGAPDEMTLVSRSGSSTPAKAVGGLIGMAIDVWIIHWIQSREFGLR